MDDIVAIRVVLGAGETRYALTWGRVFDAVDERLLLDAVTPHLAKMARGDVASVEVCDSLQEASGARYFFEAFFHLSQQAIPFGDGHEEWRARTRDAIAAGKEIHFLG